MVIEKPLLIFPNSRLQSLHQRYNWMCEWYSRNLHDQRYKIRIQDPSLFQGNAGAALGSHEAVRVAYKSAVYGAEEIEVVRQDDLVEVRFFGNILQVLYDRIFVLIIE